MGEMGGHKGGEHLQGEDRELLQKYQRRNHSASTSQDNTETSRGDFDNVKAVLLSKSSQAFHRRLFNRRD